MNAPRQIPSGAFQTPTYEQSQRLWKLRQRVRADRRYAEVLPPDLKEIDKDGDPYYGSFRHLTAFTIRELELALNRVDAANPAPKPPKE